MVKSGKIGLDKIILFHSQRQAFSANLTLKWKHFLLCKLGLVLTALGQVLLLLQQMLVGVTSDLSISWLGVCRALLSLGIYSYGAQAASCTELFQSVPVSTWFYFHVPEVCVFALAVLAIASYPTMHSKTTQFLTLLTSDSAKSVQT